VVGVGHGVLKADRVVIEGRHVGEEEDLRPL
jgi:hypothetical protein